MRYLGGKTKIAKQIASLIHFDVTNSASYYEPFFGSGAIALELVKRGLYVPTYASDYSKDLILLFEGLQKKAPFPSEITEGDYQRLRSSSPSFERSFAGFGFSFGGKFFGGYARDNRGDDYYGAIIRSLGKRKEAFKDFSFRNCSYDELVIRPNSVVYCDPPYAKTTGYTTGNFDHDAFWQWCRKQSVHSKVFISEYQAPDDFGCVLKIQKTTAVRQKTGSEVRIEKVFVYKETP